MAYLKFVSESWGIMVLYVVARTGGNQNCRLNPFFSDCISQWRKQPLCTLVLLISMVRSSQPQIFLNLIQFRIQDFIVKQKHSQFPFMRCLKVFYCFLNKKIILYSIGLSHIFPNIKVHCFCHKYKNLLIHKLVVVIVLTVLLLTIYLSPLYSLYAV